MWACYDHGERWSIRLRNTCFYLVRSHLAPYGLSFSTAFESWRVGKASGDLQEQFPPIMVPAALHGASPGIM